MAAAIGLAATACGSPSNVESDSDSVVVAVSTFATETLDPSLDGTSALIYFGPMYDSFIGADQDGTPSFENGVLESLEPNAEGTEYTMRLHPGITWQDGEAMTSEDLVFSLDYLRRPEAACTLCGYLKQNIVSAQAVDELTATVTLNAPDFNLVNLFAPTEGALQVVPKHYIERVGAEEFAKNPIGSGPWKFVNRQLGQSIEYEANTEYWNEDRVPQFSNLKLLLAPEGSTRVAMLQQKDADLALLLPGDIGRAEATGASIVGAKNVALDHVVFWGSSNPNVITHDERIREALAIAVDWDTIVSTYMPEQAGTRHAGGASPFSSISLGSDPDLAPYAYDPERAKALLAEAGYTGQPITYWNYDAMGSLVGQSEVNESIASYWRAVGVNVVMRAVDFATFRDKYKSVPQQFDETANVSVMQISARPSVISNLTINLPSQADNGTTEAYWDPASGVEEIRDLKAISDPGAFEDALREYNRKLYSEYWSIPYASQNSVWGQGPKIGSWEPTDGTDSSYNFETLTPASN